MKHKSFIITEEERNRILGMHENATNRQYLEETIRGIVEGNDEGGLDTYQNKQFNKTTQSQTTGCIQGDCENGTGTYVYESGNKYTGQFKDGQKNGTGTSVFVGGDTYTGQYKDDYKNGKGTYFYKDGSKYIGQWKDGKMNGKGTYVGIKGAYWAGDWNNDTPVGVTWGYLNKLDEKSKTPWKPELENCVKSSGGKKDEQGVYWITNTQGKWGYYSDGRYNKEGSNNFGYYYCNGNKIAYSKTPVKQGGTTQNKAPGGTTTPTYKIPPPLSNKEGVIKFQTWMEANHKGWYVGNKPIDGNFGKQTNAAWVKYGSEYMLKNPQPIGPLAPTPEPQQPTSLSFPQ